MLAPQTRSIRCSTSKCHKRKKKKQKIVGDIYISVLPSLFLKMLIWLLVANWICGLVQLYIEGYIQAMLDTVYRQEYLRVRVIDNQVINCTYIFRA